jgi:hypothetical protein
VPRSIKNALQFLGFTEKHQERSAVLELHQKTSQFLGFAEKREASRTFHSSWASPKSARNSQLFLSFANSYCQQRCSRSRSGLYGKALRTFGSSRALVRATVLAKSQYIVFPRKAIGSEVLPRKATS